MRPTRPEIITEDRRPSGVTLKIHIPAELLYFDGHFPGTPILAGVVQLEWAVALGRDYFPLAPDFLRMEAVKFQRILRPNQDITVELDYVAEKSALNFAMKDDTGPYSQGRLIFGSEIP